MATQHFSSGSEDHWKIVMNGMGGARRCLLVTGLMLGNTKPALNTHHPPLTTQRCDELHTSGAVFTQTISAMINDQWLINRA